MKLNGKRLVTDSGTYGLEPVTGSFPRFYFDCGCGGIGHFCEGSVAQETGEFRTVNGELPEQRDPEEGSHTFAMDDMNFTHELRLREIQGSGPYRFFCNNCRRRQEFDIQRYKALKAQLKRQKRAA